MTELRRSADGVALVPPGGNRPFIAFATDSTNVLHSVEHVRVELLGPSDDVDQGTDLAVLDSDATASLLEAGGERCLRRRLEQLRSSGALVAAPPQPDGPYDRRRADVALLSIEPGEAPQTLLGALLRASDRPALLDVRDARLTVDELVEAFDLGIAGVLIRTGDRAHDEELAAALSDADRARREAAPPASVIVCNHNGARYLDRCLAALTTLDYPRYEVILVDDGSTDESRAIGERHGVRVIALDKVGLSAARNAGLQAATGEWVAYIDGDTEAEPQWLMRCWRTLDRLGADGVGGPNLPFDDADWQERVVSGAPGQSTPVVDPDGSAVLLAGCNMAFLRDSARAVGGFDESFGSSSDDVSFMARMGDAGKLLVFAPTATIFHHRRDSIVGFVRQQIGWGESAQGYEARYGERTHRGGRIVDSRRGLAALVVTPSMLGPMFTGPHARGLWMLTNAPAQVGLPLKLLLLVGAGTAASAPIAWQTGSWKVLAMTSTTAVALLVGVTAARVPAHKPAAGLGGAAQRLATAALWFAQPAARRFGGLRARRKL